MNVTNSIYLGRIKFVVVGRQVCRNLVLPAKQG